MLLFKPLAFIVICRGAVKVFLKAFCTQKGQSLKEKNSTSINRGPNIPNCPNSTVPEREEFVMSIHVHELCFCDVSFFMETD